MMTLIRRDVPTVSRLWNQFFNEPLLAGGELHDGNLALDISEDDKSVIVRASVPGFTKDQIDVEVHDGILSIRAEQSEDTEDKTETYHRRERRTGTSIRRIALPDTIKDQEVGAELKDGVLTLRFAKTPEATPRKVKIG